MPSIALSRSATRATTARGRVLAIVAALSLGACTSAPAPDGGANTTGGDTGTPGASSSTGARETAGGSSTGAMTSTSSSGTTGGSVLVQGPPCAPGRYWFGETCAAANCREVPLGASCALLPDGGFGICDGFICANDNFQYDPDNCGVYGVVCPTNGGCISYGFCALAGPEQIDCKVATCPQGTNCVQGIGCMSDSCADGEGLACVLDGGPGGPPYVYPSQLGACCDDVCINPRTNPANCGNCDLACTAGQVCVGGVCTALVSCDAPSNGLLCALDAGTVGTCCLGRCTDLQSDSANCGACGIFCGEDSGCTQGNCPSSNPCPPGTFREGPSGGCTLLTCVAAAEGTLCATLDAGFDAQLCCASGCVDVDYDHDNCGGCGQNCGPGTNCIDGNCARFIDCSSPLSARQPDVFCKIADQDYAGECCAGSCANFEKNALNCGGCGLACPLGSICFNGSCMDDAGAGVSCDGGTCPPGTLCTDQGCLPSACVPTMLQQPCVGDGGVYICCGTSCIDTSTDPINCGNCGSTCPPGSACSGGVCAIPCTAQACPEGQFCTPGIVSNGPNCAPFDCTRLIDGESCTFGPGLPPQSNMAYSGNGNFCCAGECVDIFEDPQNCGACGVSCPSGICDDSVCVLSGPTDDCQVSCAPETVCAYGRCVDSLCQSGNPRCRSQDGGVGLCCGNGACADLADDPANCGACGVVCPPGQTCSGGACSGAPQCGPGHAGQLCDLDAGSSFLCCPGAGCTDVRRDSSNCGNCGSSCGAGSTCVAGSCT